MTHQLLTRADMIRDGVRIALEADTRERRVKAMEAALRCAERMQQELKKELEVLAS